MVLIVVIGLTQINREWGTEISKGPGRGSSAEFPQTVQYESLRPHRPAEFL